MGAFISLYKPAHACSPHVQCSCGKNLADHKCMHMPAKTWTKLDKSDVGCWWIGTSCTQMWSNFKGHSRSLALHHLIQHLRVTFPGPLLSGLKLIRCGFTLTAHTLWGLIIVIWVKIAGWVNTCRLPRDIQQICCSTQTWQHSPLQGSCCPVWALQHTLRIYMYFPLQ